MPDLTFVKYPSSADAGSLNHALSDTSTELLAMAPATSSANISRESVERMKANPSLTLVLQFSSLSGSEVHRWQTLPHRLAALAENPVLSAQAVVLRVSAARDLGFQDVSDPVWDFVIRASKTPGSLDACQSSEEHWIETPQRPGLVPGTPDRSRGWLLSHLESVSLEELAPQMTSRPDAIALKAGIFQIHDHLDASHELSQSVEGEGRHRAGDYWHAIMHRREPDFSNSKYWFRRVGSHPIFDPLAKAADAILSQSETAVAESIRQKLLAGGRWDPFAFVEFCQECTKGQDPQRTRIAEEIQWQEMLLLLEQTHRDATE